MLPPEEAGTFRRKTSRMSRLARFLLTASPTLRDATIPNLGSPALFGVVNSVRNLPCTLVAVVNACWNSERRRRRRDLLNRWDCIGRADWTPQSTRDDCGPGQARGEPAGTAYYEDEETVRRLRPLARRRLRTRRPFFVLMRTRKPCVRRRRRRLGWNVRFMISDPRCSETITKKLR
jgi:hypothetical protein